MSWIWKKEHDLQMQERRRDLLLLGEPMSASTHKWQSKAGICRPNVGPTDLDEVERSFWKVAGNKLGKVS